MRYLSLFSGIEAASVAWCPLGWSPVAFAETEPFPCAVLAHHYLGVPNLGDVTKVAERDISALGHIDIVVGGFPCQDLSVAGKRKGLRDEHGKSTRSGLFFDAMRIADWSAARYVIVENVPGLFSSNGGRDFACVVGEMAGTEFDVPESGWANTGVAVGPRGLVEWSVLDAQWFGVPQRRRRIFLVRDSGNWRGRPPILFEPTSLRGDPAPSRKAGERVALPVTTRVDCGGEHREAHGNNLIAGTLGAHSSSGRSYGSRPIADNLIANTLQKHHGNPQLDQTMVPMLVHSLRADGFDATSEDGTGRGTQVIAIQERAVCENPDAGPDGAGFRDDGMAYTLEARTVPQAVAYFEGDRHDELGNGAHEGAEDLPTGSVREVWQREGGGPSQERGLEGSSTGKPPAPMPQLPYEGPPENEGVPNLRRSTQGSLVLRETLPETQNTRRSDETGMAGEKALCSDGLRIDEPCARPMQQTCTTGETRDTRQVSENQKRVRQNTMAVRRLTPMEAERLMGFPDDYTLIQVRGKPAADGPRYGALGNSFAVPVVRWIGERIQAVHEITANLEAVA